MYGMYGQLGALPMNEAAAAFYNRPDVQAAIAERAGAQAPGMAPPAAGGMVPGTNISLMSAGIGLAGVAAGLTAMWAIYR